jgi:hypothetical protein
MILDHCFNNTSSRRKHDIYIIDKGDYYQVVCTSNKAFNTVYGSMGLDIGSKMVALSKHDANGLREWFSENGLTAKIIS